MCRAIIAFDSGDRVHPGAPKWIYEEVALVIKAQGFFRPGAPGMSTSASLLGAPSTARPMEFDGLSAAKLRLSLPCFACIEPVIRHRMRLGSGRNRVPVAWMRHVAEAALIDALRRIVSVKEPKQAVHLLASLTHVQRLDAIEALRRAQLAGDVGITDVPDLFYGVSELMEVGHGGRCHRQLGDEDVLVSRPFDPQRDGAWTGEKSGLALTSGRLLMAPPAWRASVSGRITDAGLMRPKMNRAKYLTRLAGHRYVVAPSGYGELTFRHGEALLLGRTLVCPTLEHVETMFPFEDGRNVVYCAADMSDVAEVVQSLPASRAKQLAQRGLADWRWWCRKPEELLWSGITKHVLEALEVG